MQKETTAYRIIVDGIVRKTVPSEQEALMYVKRMSQRHRRAEFIIEQFEAIFDFQNIQSHKKLLKAFRDERWDNSIHAGIRTLDSNIGDDEFS